MKRIAKTLALSMVLFVGCAFTLPATMGTLESHAASKVKISKTKATVIKGKTITLKVKGTKKKAKWSSSKKSVATVSSKGKVTAKKAGKATITAKIGKKKYRCKVTVKNPTTKLNKSAITLDLGGKYTLKATSNGKSKKASWKSSNSSVASVNSKGVVTAKKGGTTKITVSMNGVSKSCKVTVRPYRTYKEGEYKVGTDIPAGQYYLFETGNYSAYFSISKNSSGSIDSILANDVFSYNSIIDVSKGQYLELQRCYAVPAAYAKVSTSGEGMFKVGRDIPAGEYKLVSTSSIMAYYEVAPNALHDTSNIVSNDNFSGTKYVTVNNGQYLKLQRCKIKK